MIRPLMECEDFLVESAHQSFIGKFERLQETTLRVLEYQTSNENRKEISLLKLPLRIDDLETRRKQKLVIIMINMMGI